MRRYLPLLLLIVLIGCNGQIPPIPIPTPPACPETCPEGQECTNPRLGCQVKPEPPQECLPGVAWCHEVGLTCSTPEKPCKHNPTSDPAHCELAPACPTPPPTDPCSVCPPGTSCIRTPLKEHPDLVQCIPNPVPPTPTGCDVDEYQMAPVQAVATRTKLVNDAITVLGNTAGKPPAETLERLAAEIRKSGVCADAGSEAVFVARDVDALWEEYHAVYFGTGALIPGGKYMTSQRLTGQPPPTPGAGGCSDPMTPRVNQWGLTLRNKFWDSTPLFYNGEAATWGGLPVNGYCNAVGFQRVFCPARMECEEGKNNFKCEERRACEGYGIGGFPTASPLFRCEQGQPEVNAGGFGARCPSGSKWIEACDTAGLNCTRQETP